SGHVLGSVLIGGVQALLFFLIGLVYMPVLSFSPISILAIALVLVGACFFGVLGTLLGARVSFSNFSLAFTLASIPLVYASTIFVPAMDFPEGLRWLVLLNPVSIVVDLLRSAMLGVSSWPGLPGGLPAAVLVDGVLLAVYSAAILLLALSLHDRFPRGKSPMKKGNAARDDGELATEISNLVANIVGKEKLAELLPLVQQGRIDELLKQFPRETVEKLLDLVRETINKHVPATNK
ncbi:MAG: ABC transporter permease, partial [Candidatus Lokiarchaeota archaeon]|nr:ABC transporter permease [Candidatus Lokiarchaeota archaeon]